MLEYRDFAEALELNVPALDINDESACSIDDEKLEVKKRKLYSKNIATSQKYCKESSLNTLTQYNSSAENDFEHQKPVRVLWKFSWNFFLKMS